MLIKIGELAKRTGATVETIRYYEKERLLPEPFRSEGNYRLYRESHIGRLQFILHCRTLDMTLDEVRTLLKYWEEPNRDCGDVDDLLDEHIQAVETRIKELKQLKKHLSVLRKKCDSETPAKSCGILDALADNSCHENLHETH
ncbi:Cd(II)/Pb(II)-responsive transcriptional regulator [Psychrobacter sp. AOP7-A1-24]|uniref:Cd(II)/Pb(II)-responsive transcriptional regulator n=1 Tax=Psychrobacter sp. AOP7-A1-24 TaxID=3457646 RepID=UPI00402B8983